MLKQFLLALAISGGDLVLVNVVQPNLVRVLVLEADGLERVHEWL